MSDSERTADALLRVAVEASPSGLLMTDEEGRIVLVNRQVERLFGYSREELLGRSVEILVPEGARSAHRGLAADFVAHPRPRALGTGRDLHGLRKDGEAIPVEIGLTPVETEEGVRVLAAIVDIRERKRAEAERRSLERQLRHSQKMEAVGTLAGGIAHDFNNILAVITMYAELLVESAPDPGMEADARSVLTAARRGKELVQRILSFSRRQETVRQPVSVSHVIRETEPLLRASLPARIDIRLSTTADDEVLGDATSLQQVLMNLAANAAQAMPVGGSLEISSATRYLTDSAARRHPTLEEGPYVALVVKDTGEGIDPALRSRVFEPFFTTKPVGTGTGLGLALVHSIVTEHGGVVDLESEVDVGTTVRCLLPALERERDETVPGATTTLEALPKGSGERVLLVDDETALAEGGGRRLRRLGYRVGVYSDARAALDALTRDPTGWDAVVTDLTMPGLDGIELARAVTAIRPDIPVVLVTGHLEDLGTDTLASAGVAEVLKKPTTLEEMARKLAAVFGRGGDPGAGPSP